MLILISRYPFRNSSGLKRKHQGDMPNNLAPRHFTVGSMISDPIVDKRRARVFAEFEPAEKPPFPGHLPLASSQALRRSSSIELLIKIFPKIKVSVLQLILQSCSGDLVQAIEDVLSKCRNDPTVLLDSTPWPAGYAEEIHNEYRHQRAESFKLSRSDAFIGSQRSAFTPLPSLAKTHFYPGAAGPVAFTIDSNRSKENLQTGFLSLYVDPRIVTSHSAAGLVNSNTPSRVKDFESEISLQSKNSEDSTSEKDK